MLLHPSLKSSGRLSLHFNIPNPDDQIRKVLIDVILNITIFRNL